LSQHSSVFGRDSQSRSFILGAARHARASTGCRFVFSDLLSPNNCFFVQMLLNAIESPHSAASIPLTNEAPPEPSLQPASSSSFTASPSNTPQAIALSAATPSELPASPPQHRDPNHPSLSPCDAPDELQPLSPQQLKAVARSIADAFFEKRIAFQQLFVLADSAQEVTPLPHSFLTFSVSLSLIVRAVSARCNWPPR
jgi:hypothetical protein